MTSKRGRTKGRGSTRSPGDLVKFGLLGVLCLAIAGLVALHVRNQTLVSRTEKDWRIAGQTKDKARLARISARA